jgi:hypothetical protein
VTKEELHAAAKGRGFSIPAGSQEETDFLLLQNSFDAVASAVAALPGYIDPRVEPTPVEGGERRWSKPTSVENPLNAWSHKVDNCVVFQFEQILTVLSDKSQGIFSYKQSACGQNSCHEGQC